MPLNIVLVLADSLNKHFLEPYGGPRGLTPNLERFATNALQFDNHYVGSLPCMPARRELFSGRKDFLWRPWGHLEAFDRPLPRELERAGYKTQLITDHFHYWEDGAHGYLESFQGTELIRGHEIDAWKTDPLNGLPEWVQAIEKYRPGQGLHYYRNVKDFSDEQEFFSAKVMSTAAQWLRRNHADGPYFLQVETFDVHEPFHCPEPYRSQWSNRIDPTFTCWPPYQNGTRQQEFFRQTTEDELEFIRGQYAGKVAMWDRWFGHLLDIMDALQVWDDTVVIVTTDHGHDLGEREAFAKSFPHWDSHANIPLFVWHPKFGARRRTQSLTSTVDLYATILDLGGVRDVPRIHTRSLEPIIAESQSKIRDAILYGTFGAGVCCTDGEYVLMQGYDNERFPLYHYSGRLSLPTRDDEPVTSGSFIPDVSWPVWKIPIRAEGVAPSILVARGSSIGQEVDFVDSQPDLARRMREVMVRLMKEEGCPKEQYDRLGLTSLH